MKQVIAAAALSVAAIGSAFAGPTSDAAQTHFKAIADADMQIIMRGYGANPQLIWVGGPLDGTYTSSDAIRGVWEKFTESPGPLKVSYHGFEELSNRKGSTVTANVQFEGKQPIKVRYVLTYREDGLVSETWQIDSKMTAGEAY